MQLLETNCRKVCRETKLSYGKWLDERKYRITGTTCYSLFTYSSNKQPNRDKKCSTFFEPKDFKTEYTEYGKVTEAKARCQFEKVTNQKVVETGLVVSQQNFWLACSPDGIIFEREKPNTLVEIKCPFAGKSMPIDEAMKSQFGKCLSQNDKGEMSLKKKHCYYGQVQLGMAVLNIEKCLFIIYADYDKSFITLTVNFNKIFTLKMLTTLKKVYFNIMVHKICVKSADIDINNKNIDTNNNCTGSQLLLCD